MLSALPRSLSPSSRYRGHDRVFSGRNIGDTSQKVRDGKERAKRVTKTEEEKAITYSGNRPNCPRPRSYGSPHCRDAGAERAIPFSVTFSIGADDGAEGKGG